MKDIKEYVEDISYKIEYADNKEYLLRQLEEILLEIRIESWNSALKSVSELSITSKKIYQAEKDDDEWDLDSLWCNKFVILKHKITKNSFIK